MFLVIEIILITLIVISAVVYFIWHLRKELKGSCACGDVCDSCKIKENCNEPKSFDKTIEKSRRKY